MNRKNNNKTRKNNKNNNNNSGRNQNRKCNDYIRENIDEEIRKSIINYDFEKANRLLKKYSPLFFGTEQSFDKQNRARELGEYVWKCYLQNRDTRGTRCLHFYEDWFRPYYTPTIERQNKNKPRSNNRTVNKLPGLKSVVRAEFNKTRRNRMML